MPGSSYRALATKPVLTWSAVAFAARLPVAMAPLAFVFLGRSGPGGYALGAVLAAGYVVGEVVGAPVLGMWLRPTRARAHLTGGLVVGAAAFAVLGAFPATPPAVQGSLALVAGAAPAAVPGGLRTMLTDLVDKELVVKALSAESMQTLVVWSVAPAAASALAIGVAPGAPLLLAGALMATAVVGLRWLPLGWRADSSDRRGVSMARTVLMAWPVYVSGAAAMSLLALAELVLPALLERRGIAVGWAGPLLAGYSMASALGAYLYGLRRWPGRLHMQGIVLLLGVSACVAAAGVLPALGWIAVALLVGGVLESGLQVARSLGLREALPPSALAAGYSAMYAAVGVGYVGSASLSGAMLRVSSPPTAMLCGVALTLVLTAVSAVGERRLVRAGSAQVAPPATVGTSAI